MREVKNQFLSYNLPPKTYNLLLSASFVISRAISFLVFLPSLTLRVLLPEIAKRKFLNASLFSLKSLAVSFSVLFLYSDIFLIAICNLALIKLKFNARLFY